MEDSRFSRIKQDARFKKIPKREKKVKIDKRFQSMFHDKRFQLKSLVDKRGRPTQASGSKHLERYYDLSESSSENSDKEETVISESGSDDENETEDKDELSFPKVGGKDTVDPQIKEKLRDLTIDYARGEGRILSDSSSDEESENEAEEENVQHEWGELDKDAETTEESTARLALCNVDWDRITSQDLMVLFNSFLPPGGILKSVKIYPSEFGLKRMAEEDEKGPIELTSETITADKEAEDEISPEEREKLRQYQLKRLRYYYGVLEFDSPNTANHIYSECDGLEYESSMNRLDLRFIPDDTTFEQEPRESCSELPDLSTYKPRLFRTTALTQVKVDLTWDETDPTRQEAIRAVHSGADDARIGQFLASSSEDEEEEIEVKQVVGDQNEENTTEKGAIQKYKALLADLEKSEASKKDEISMEVSWDLKLEQRVAENVKNTSSKNENMTPFEKLVEKKKDKKKQKKEERKKLLNHNSEEENDEGEENAFSDDEIPSDVDLNDPYFKEELESSKTKANKKNKKKNDKQSENEEDKQKQAELELLMMDEVNEGPKKHFSLKKIEENEKQSKRKKLKRKKITETKQSEDDFKMDVKDERFSAIFSSHHYNVDPAEAQYKPTAGMKAIIAEKLRRVDEQPQTKIAKMEPKTSLDAELNMLVKSVRRKSEEVKKKKGRINVK